MPLFSNTGEKLNFLAAADSVLLVSLSLSHEAMEFYSVSLNNVKSSSSTPSL